MLESTRDEDIRLYNAIEKSDVCRVSTGSYVDWEGNITWYNELGQRHRKDGPAVIKSDGKIYWYFNGDYYLFNEWCNKVNIPDEQKLLLRLQYA